MSNLTLTFYGQSPTRAKQFAATKGGDVGKDNKNEKLPIDFTKPLKQCWSFFDNKVEADKIASDNDSAKIGNNNRIFIPYLDGKVSAINNSAAEKIWESDLGGKIISKLLADDKHIFVLSKSIIKEPDIKEKNVSQKLMIRALDKENGLTVWQMNFDLEDKDQNKLIEKETVGAEMILVDSNLIIVANNFIFSLNKPDGKLQWRKNQKNAFPFEILVAENNIIVKNPENSFYVISARTGNTIESTGQAEKSSASIYQPTKRRIIFGDYKGKISIINLKYNANSSVVENQSKSNLSIWKFRNGAEISGISLTAEGLLVSSLDNFLYMLSERNGEIIWKKRLSGRIIYKPLIEESFAAVINTSEPTALIVDLANGKTVNKIVLDNQDFFTGDPLKIGNKLLLFTQRGVFAYSDSSDSKCSKIQ